MLRKFFSYGDQNVHPFDAFMLRCLGIIGIICTILGVKFLCIEEYMAGGIMFFFSFLLFRDVYVVLRNMRELAQLDRLVEEGKECLAHWRHLHDEYSEYNLGEKRYDKWTL